MSLWDNENYHIYSIFYKFEHYLVIDEKMFPTVLHYLFYKKYHFYFENQDWIDQLNNFNAIHLFQIFNDGNLELIQNEKIREQLIFIKINCAENIEFDLLNQIQLAVEAVKTQYLSVLMKTKVPESSNPLDIHKFYFVILKQSVSDMKLNKTY